MNQKHPEKWLSNLEAPAKHLQFWSWLLPFKEGDLIGRQGSPGVGTFLLSSNVVVWIFRISWGGDAISAGDADPSSPVFHVCNGIISSFGAMVSTTDKK